ncbi:tetratricopeptide repeat protein [Phormidium sp. FACHB-1136]|uniref:CHAT domain-containing tetratricopeptide repeat protein n=1 Tax=Phormidium sp. FACHB-1136 TaxID=2692848 RepID=UPI0016890E06|nr:tetratricopeptide repeat protein [Phormidium sp. FACHB-1136]MBD2429177.1 tetratricopeptide repeat protein [Phormidium sp. FACHB-1136]
MKALPQPIRSLVWNLQNGKPPRLVSLALLTALLVGQSPRAWSQPLNQGEAMRVAQSVPEFEPLTITGVLDENGAVADGRFLNGHMFEGMAGQIVVIDLISDEFDALLALIGPDDEPIAADNNGGEGTNARLVLSLSKTGIYQVGALSVNPGETGRYRLTVKPGTMADLERVEQLAEATRLNAQSAELYRDGRYGEAEPLLQESLAIRREQLGDSHPDVAQSLNNLAELYRSQGRYKEAETLFQQALAIRREQLSDSHPDVAQSLNNLAGLYRSQGRYREAEPFLREALMILREQFGDSHPDVAQSLNNLAVLHQEQGRYGEAETLLQQALAIRREQLGESHLSVATSLLNLAGLYQAQGLLHEAETLLQQALVIYREQLGENHPSVATSINNLAELYRAQGRYEEAEPLHQQALAIRQEQLGASHPAVIISILNLAGLYWQQGRYGEAETFAQQALAISQRQLGRSHPDVAASLNSLAVIYQEQGRYGEAETLFQQALAIRREQLGEIHPDVATSLLNLAGLYQKQGRYGEAETLMQQALAMHREQLGENHPNVAISLNNLASLYQVQRRYEEAELFYQDSLAIRREQLGANHPSIATSLNNLADLYRVQGRYEEAEPLHRQALAISQEQLGESHPDIATSLNNLALVYQDQGLYGEAEPLHREALLIRREQLGESHPSVATSLINLALLSQKQGEIAPALTWLHQGLSVEESNLSLNLAIGSDDRKRAYIATISGTTDLALSLHLQNAATNPTAARLALTTVLRRKGRVLDAVTDTQQLLRQNLSPDLAPLLDEYTAAQTQLAAQLYGGLGDQDPEVYRARIDELRQEANRLENELSRRSAEFRVETEPVEIEAVQALIPADAALVELLQYRPLNPAASQAERWGQPRYAAYILHNSGDPKWVDLGDAEPIDTAARAFLAATRNPNSGNRARTTARALDELVMAPIRPLLGEATHLLLSPDSQLNLIPFAALVDEQNRYLVETYTLTHLTTGRDLLRLQNKAPSQQPPVLFANPNYDTASISNSPLPMGEGPGVRANPGSAERSTHRSTDITNLRFGPLPGTQQEVDAIAPLLPNNAIILTEATATENALKQVQAPSILHIATHGFFLEDVDFVSPPSTRGDRATGFLEPTGLVAPPTRPVNNENPLLRSGLALAGFNSRTSAGEDGVLTALEATGLNLRGTRLVVMSACETGVGQVANGEGVYGLRRAFVMAGAESQLMSLWKVDDLGTAELMQRYYQRLQNGKGRSESLRQVQLEFMANPTYQHPYYWASFIFSGEWRPLE